MDNACHHVRACRGGRTLLAQSRLAALWLAAEASAVSPGCEPRRPGMTRQHDMLTLHVSGHIPHKHRRRAVDHLNGRSSSTGVTLALPRSSGANAAAHERQAARLTHTSASTARTTWKCRTCGDCHAVEALLGLADIDAMACKRTPSMLTQSPSAPAM